MTTPPPIVWDATLWREFWPRPADMLVIAPGVRGVVAQHGGYFWVGSISAVKPGSGDVGRYLDALPRKAAFPSVISTRLSEMLARRGFRFEQRLFYVEKHREWVDGWVRDA